MKNFHLVHEDDKYKLKRENAKRASKVIDANKTDAIKQSRDFIKSQGGGSLKIHKNKGGFHEERPSPRANAPRKTKG
jgi:hypothetical protein